MSVAVPVGLIGRSRGMSIRICAWPECESRFPTAQGPSTVGWKVFGNSSAQVLLCPFHSTSGHAPLVTTLTRTVVPARFSCVCDRWAGSLVDSILRGVQEWQGHVSVTLRDL